MLSDEEKKEYEELKSLLYQGTLTQYGKRKLIGIIEKQSKEIEELKNNIHLKEVYVLKTNDYIKGRNVVDELCNKKWEDKIKAKIEEAKKNYNDLHTKHLRDCGIAEQRELAKIEVLQSLLEKE